MEELYGLYEVEKDRRFEKDLPGGRLGFTRLSRAPEIGPYLELLNSIWGFNDADKIPLHEVVVLAKTGGLFMGIDLAGRPAGLVYVMPAYNREWGYHHHSNFLGIIPEARSMGIGLEAKRAHAVLAARDNVTLVTWTFDPLRSANANLNFRKLGCFCHTLLRDLYGGMGGTFDPGLPTDRFLVEWRIDSKRVRERLRGNIPPPDKLASRHADVPVITSSAQAADISRAGPYRLRARIPEEIIETAAHDQARARKGLSEFSDLMESLFDAGFMVTEMIPTDGENFYLLDKGVDT